MPKFKFNNTFHGLNGSKKVECEASVSDLLPDEDYDSFMREMLEADTNPDYDPEVPLVAGGYIDDQSKWYDGTGEWLLYLLGFLSGALLALVALYALEFWL